MNSKQINKMLHGLRNILPEGCTWKVVQDDCYQAMVRMEVHAKLSDRAAPISDEDIYHYLQRKYSRKIVKLGVWALIERKRLLRRKGLQTDLVSVHTAK